MSHTRQVDRSLAYLLLRGVLGVNICVHGVARLIAGPSAFAATLAHTFANTPLPRGLVIGFALGLPWLEATIGLLILLGLLTRYALLAGGALMVVLTFGSTLHQDWDAAGLQLIYVAVYAALLAMRSYNGYAVDALFAGAKHER